MSDHTQVDVAIVGAGASGLTAALFTARRGLTTLILSQDIGGQASTTSEVENYPGISLVTGPDLMVAFLEQAQRAGATLRATEVTSIERHPNETFTLTTADGATIDARAVILCFGLTPRHLDVPGEEQFTGHGLHYGLGPETCSLAGQRIVVVGGGSSAMTVALALAPKNDVTIVHRGDAPRGESVLMERLAAAAGITTIPHSQAREIIGDVGVTAVRIGPEDGDGETRDLPADHVFAAVGYLVKPDLATKLATLDAKNQVVVSGQNETSVPGLFAAGDVTTLQYKQIVISAGDGAKAGLNAAAYLTTRGSNRRLTNDWGRKKSS